MTEELITTEEVKLHCRIDGDEEDQLISGYIAASLEACQIHIGRRFDDGLEFTPAIKIGCMMFIAHLYENRQIVADNAKTRVPMTIGALWTAYRDVGGVLMPWQPLRRCTEPAVTGALNPASVRSTGGRHGVQRMPDEDTAARVDIPDSGTNTAPCI